MRPDCIALATGSGGTQGGLIIGNALYGLGSRIMSFAVCDDTQYFRNKFCEDAGKLKARYRDLLPEGFSPEQLEIETLDGYIGPAYAKAGPEVFETIARVARTEGIILDPVYTGKAFHGMLQEVGAGRLREAKHVVFIHTGGLFGVFPQCGEFSSVLPVRSEVRKA
jgi:D-cysteine desulfhydrase